MTGYGRLERENDNDTMALSLVLSAVSLRTLNVRMRSRLAWIVSLLVS